MSTETQESARTAVERAMAQVILPEAYAVIDALLSAQGNPPKALVVRARRLLPGKFANSFEYTGDKT